LLLSTKQAAFIRNPDYAYEGNGPEIVTIGHNPFQPNLGLARHVVLHAAQSSGIYASISASVHFNSSTHHAGSGHGLGPNKVAGRKKFVDEYLYDRLFLAQKPFTLSILRALRRTMETGSKVVRGRVSTLNSSVHSHSSPRHANLNSSVHRRSRKSLVEIPDEPLPYGVHHIDPNILNNSDTASFSVLADFVAANKELLKPKILKDGLSSGLLEKSCDPAVRLAFSSKLDSQTRQIQDLQVNVQQFYECRIASLERYIAFCVMFHAMAADCHKPWLMTPWDIARSQSNLRVATTGKFS
jgi:hypothetical protein